MHTISLPAPCLYLYLPFYILETVFFGEPKTALGRAHTRHPQTTRSVFPPCLTDTKNRSLQETARLYPLLPEPRIPAHHPNFSIELSHSCYHKDVIYHLIFAARKKKKVCSTHSSRNGCYTSTSLLLPMPAKHSEVLVSHSGPSPHHIKVDFFIVFCLRLKTKFQSLKSSS